MSGSPPEERPEAEPLAPFSISELAWEEWSQGAAFGSRVRRVVDSRGGKAHIGAVIEEILPGMQSCPFHYHFLEEEHVMVLQGTVTLRLGAKTWEMKEGDYVRFPAGQEAGHCFVNQGTQLCRIFCFGERVDKEVVVYPDTGKVLVALTGEIYRKDATVDYWEGERGA